MKHSVCVFCSSSSTLDEKYYEDSRELGELLGKNNFDMVYGGSSVGMMYEVARLAKSHGSKILGVMPEKLYNFGVSSKECDKFHLTTDMRSRKLKMDELSDSIIALAGGFGTLEEVSEMIVQKQLGYNSKPIVLLNVNRFYDNLIGFFDTIIKENFAKSNAKELYFVASTPEEAVEYLNNYQPKEVSLASKF